MVLNPYTEKYNLKLDLDLVSHNILFLSIVLVKKFKQTRLLLNLTWLLTHDLHLGLGQTPYGFHNYVLNGPYPVFQTVDSLSFVKWQFPLGFCTFLLIKLYTFVIAQKPTASLLLFYSPKQQQIKIDLYSVTMAPPATIRCCAAALTLMFSILIISPSSSAIYCDEDDCYDLLGSAFLFYYICFFFFWFCQFTDFAFISYSVTQTANASEIKKAYYKLSLKQ
jgi:hypothetical protein